MGWFSRNKTKKLPPRPGGPVPVPVDTRPCQGQTPPAQYHAPQTSGITEADSSCPGFQPAGYLPPPSGWNEGLSPPPPYPYQQQAQQAPVVVNQHYYLLAPPPSNGETQGHHGNAVPFSRMVIGSAVNLADQLIPGVVPTFLNDGLNLRGGQSNQFSGPGAAAMNQICDRFNDVMTQIDRDRYAGNERDLFTYHADSASDSSSSTEVATRGQLSRPKKNQSPTKGRDAPKGQTTAVAASVMSGNYFAKVELYANSRLPMNLPPLKLYIPTWPLLCLAAQYSDRVYEKARGAEKDFQVGANFHSGARAMTIKSVPMDHMNTIVFAIRGTATFMDWAVNLNTAPTSPAGFLDDAGNYCHSGFLTAARKMIKPVAARLRQLLQEDPGRASYSLLITGHSAGGAVAALLYAHMLSTSKAAQSELNSLTGCFRRVHCVTFGAPPITLLPLQKPEGRADLRKSLFLSFVNEGDPVARADKAYVRSLLELFATPAPVTTTLAKPPSKLALLECPKQKQSKSSLVSAKSGKSTKSSKSRGSSAPAPANNKPVWKVPPSPLSNAGRIVVLRSGEQKARLKGKKTVEERLNEGVVAQMATDEQLRGIIWGDPVCHVMKLYAGRLEILAVGAVTAKGY
ncbi:hypothetical protein J7T55_004630 [Diaporthe amygdali]|uniref:uncharacterized protein n=1 Tax=Phomopsis amygdali TaxID=1214568 RepID=UPI0022FE934F|nr:uncharacterized protein J7T55_004630 [Diaporthe amygdali]KAJ0114888.1 hypothetical protein J7T55_004630 [Diaporthe amygdali]